MIRVLELSKQLRVEANELLSLCALLQIPATSRISCLSDDHIKQIKKKLKEEHLKDLVN